MPSNMAYKRSRKLLLLLENRMWIWVWSWKYHSITNPSLALWLLGLWKMIKAASSLERSPNLGALQEDGLQRQNHIYENMATCWRIFAFRSNNFEVSEAKSLPQVLIRFPLYQGATFRIGNAIIFTDLLNYYLDRLGWMGHHVLLWNSFSRRIPYGDSWFSSPTSFPYLMRSTAQPVFKMMDLTISYGCTTMVTSVSDWLLFDASFRNSRHGNGILFREGWWPIVWILLHISSVRWRYEPA